MTNTIAEDITPLPLLNENRRSDRRDHVWRKWSNYLLALSGWAIFLGLWEIAPKIGLLDPVFSSAPSLWIPRLWELLSSGELLTHIWATMKVMLMGLGLSFLIGVPVGIAAGWFRIFNRMSSSLTSALYALPYIALVPLIILWFGIGDTARAIIVFWAAVFPILLNTVGSVRNLDADHIRIAKAFCAPQLKTLWTLVLPGALPYVLTGIRLAVGRALVAAVVAEFFMGSRGLGYFISASSSNFDMESAFAAMAVTAAAGVVLVGVTTLVEQKYSAWSITSE